MRKRIFRRLATAALSLAVTLSVLPTALASAAMGENRTVRSTELAGGVTLTTRNMWSNTMSDLRAEYYITCTPGSGVTPIVYSGKYVTSTTTVANAARAMESVGYRVLGGINGGFFNGDGTVVGALMTEGVVRSLDLYNYAMVGFTADGHAFMDESKPVKTASWTASAESEEAPDEPVLTDYSFPIAGFNALRSQDNLGGLYLYNQDFNSRVNQDARRDCVAVVLARQSGGDMTMDCTLTFAVEGKCDTADDDVFNGVLPEGRYMLYANDYDNPGLLAALRALRPGDKVTVSVSGASEKWDDAEYGLTGLYPLLRNGQIVSGLPNGSDPRTAIGIMADGTPLLYTIDGRQNGYSVGATYEMVAERLQELGCVYGAAMDGGGSTTLGATLPGSASFSVLNSPSGGFQRAVNNCVLLTVPAGTAILSGGYYPESDWQVVLTGASVNLTAKNYDAAGNPAGGTSPNWSAKGGALTSNGLNAVYTAGNTAGDYQIATDGGALTIHVTDTLSTLTLSKEGSSSSLSSLTLEPKASVSLTAAGKWWNLPVAMTDSDVTWRCDAAIGTIDAAGNFTAADANVSGKITASAGGKTATLSVRVYNGVPFTDVPIHSWYTDAVRYAVEHKLMNGVTDTVFEPGVPATRGMLMTILARMSGVSTAGSHPWYQTGMDWAVEKGVSDGTHPENVITREQLATMLWRYADEPSADPSALSDFSDGERVSPWAADAMAWAVEKGILEGFGGALSPKNSATRAQMAVILMRYCQM